jgi:tetratricopeptide (TPR) repeat protein
MSLENIPDVGSTEELPPENRQPDASFAKRKRIAAIVAACLILVLPVFYLVFHYGLRRNVSAHSVPPRAQGPSIEQLEELVRANPTYDNRINLSVAYINGNQPGRATPILDALRAEDANNRIVWNNLCVAHTMQMEYNTALDDCREAVRIAPDFQLAQNNLKWAEDEFKKTQEAIAKQEQVDPASRDAAFYLAEGLNFLHIGGYDQAVKAWQRVLDLDPRNAIAANNIGIAYMFKKQPDKAIPWFEKAIALDATMQLAKNNLSWARDEASKSAK